MQIKIKDNIKQFSKGLTNVEKKKLPLITRSAINNTLFGLKKEMAKQTIKKLDKPTPFTQKGFFIDKAKGKKLSGKLFIRPEVAKYLRWVIDGGLRDEKRMIPVPFTANARLNKFGNIVGKRSGLIKKKSQFIGTIKNITGVWERFNKGKNVKLIIGFKPSVQYEGGKFPFYRIGKKYVENTFNKHLTKAYKFRMKQIK
tara:strand:+ start:764 stop:1360 length:597 start_codon:yes stop_codon:yes gene_type:complete